MCGIAAVLAAGTATARVWGMLDTIRHRGPDGAGVAALSPSSATVSKEAGEPQAAGDVVLGHVRLAILDLSDAGFQPMTDPAQRTWVVFNGEIFNHQSLRDELRGKGHVFTSRTDTEVLVHGWNQWGEGLLDRIEGMFAFCIHDRSSGTTMLARDRLGIKPMYYGTADDGAFVAASEVKALLAAGLSPALDPAGIDSFLRWLWVPDPDTAFKGVRKLAPGTRLLVRGDGHQDVRAYWDFERGQVSEGHADAAAVLGCALEEAVTRQLMSDVPLGAFFSGGLDSTAIVEIMRRALAPERPTCFTIGFSERDLAHDVVSDDLRHARAYARSAAVDYREAILEPSLVDVLPKVVWHMDEPIADPAALSAYQISQAASEEFTVLLSGAGGDELFGGYPRYVATACARKFRQLPPSMRSVAKRLALSLPAAGTGGLARTGRNAQKFVRGAGLPFPDDYLALMTYLDDASRSDLYTGEFAAAIAEEPPMSRHREHLERANGAHWFDQVTYLDLKTYLPALNLTYMDKMSMAHSIEVRVPLLDELVLDVMRRVEPEDRLRGRHRKVLFKRALEGLVPQEIISRPKAGFTAPVRGWLSNELGEMVDDLLSPAAIRRRGLFRPEAVERLRRDFASGRRDNALQIWQLVTLELWQQIFLDVPARDPERRLTVRV